MLREGILDVSVGEFIRRYALDSTLLRKWVEDDPPHMRAVLQTGPYMALIYPEQLLTREEGTASIQNPQLLGSSFSQLINMRFPRQFRVNIETENVQIIRVCNC